LAQLRKIAHICVLFNAYTGKWVCRATGDRLQSPCYLSSVDHDEELDADIIKYSFVNKTIQLWNQLPVDALGTLL
jgi:hypothetical protein